jgi:hypothetical protein
MDAVLALAILTILRLVLPIGLLLTIGSIASLLERRRAAAA